MADLMTNAQLAQLINDALAKWNAREAEQYAWVSGSATGGPNGDGRFPLSNGSGSSNLIDSPAKLADLLNGPAALAGAARDEAQVFRDAAQSAATAASTDKTLANNSKLAAQDARDLAMLYRDQTAALQATVSVSEAAVAAALASVTTKEANVITLHGETLVARDDAVVAKTAAEAAAALAATFNPNDYYTKVASDGRYVQLTNFNWSSLSNKPGVFPPEAHTHSIAQITGLQAALDGKQAAGSYAAAVHTHVIGDVSGLQAALDGKSAVGHTHSYLPLSGGVLTGQLKTPDLQVEFNSGTSWSTMLAAPWDNPAEVLNMNVNGFAAITFHVANKYANLFGYDENNVLKTNNSVIWHSGNFNPDSKLTVTAGVSNLSQLNLGDSSKFIRGGSSGQTILGVGDVNSAFLQVGGSYYSIWNAGNFDPNSKLNTSGGTMTGSLTMSSSPIIMAFSGSLPYMDLQATGVSGGRNYRIRSGIEGVTNGGFSIRDLTSGTNVLGVDSTGTVFAYNGLYVSGGAVFRSDWTNDYQSSSDFVDGTLVTTDIPANVLHGDSFEIEITGKSYNAANPPFKVIAQGYLYNGGIIAYSGISYGGDFSDNIKVFEEGGVLKFWWPRISYWNSFRVSVVASMYATNGTITRNRVTSITNSTEPTGTKKVAISLHRSIVSTPGGFTNINRPYANLLSLYNTGGTGTRIQLADNVWAANIRHDSGNLMFQTQGENTRLFLGNGVAGIGTGNTSDSALRVLSSTGAGFRVGFNGSAENYYDAGYHAIRHITGAAIMEMYPSTIYARQDLYASSGNIFVRENPSGAGSGMRLHHNGGGAYIDYDGDLNFRTGDGSGLAAITSSGGFIAAGITSTGDLRVGGYTSATGFTMLNNGTLSNPGYLSWYAPGGTRVGYMGWAEGSNIVYQAEAGWGLKFNSNVTFATSNPLYASAGIQTLGQIRACGWYAAPSGGSYTALGVEIGVSGGNGYIYAYDRNASAYGPLRLGGSNIYAENPFTFNSTAVFGSTVDIYGGNLRVISGGGDSAMGAYIGFRNSVGERGWVGYGEGNSRMRVNNSIGSVWVSGTDVQLVVNNAGSSARVATAYGYLDLGPVNSSWCHYNTDRPAHYFNTAVHVNGAIMRYNEGAALHHGSSSMGSGRITVSTSSPSGGADGDVWFKVA